MTQIKMTDMTDDFAWIREVREKIYEETKHMTHEEFSEYMRKGTAEFERNIRRIREQKKGGENNER